VLEPVGVVGDDRGDVLELVPQADQLVHLLLVLGDDDPDLRVAEDVDDLLADAGRVDPDHRRADGLGGELADQPLRAVVAEDGDDVAGADPELGEPVGEVADPRAVAGPGDRLPDAVPLLLEGDAAPVPVTVGEARPAASGTSDPLGPAVEPARRADDCGGIGPGGGGRRGARRSHELLPEVGLDDLAGRP
jgi:hypothetical protein